MKKIYGIILGLILVGASLQARRNPMKIKSSAFEYGALIPKQYTCDGADFSPPLSFLHVPKKAQSLAMIFENKDSAEKIVGGGTWVHWFIFNIPPTVSHIAEDADINSLGGIIGRNTWSEHRYSGPCPSHNVGTYHFTLYALDKKLDLGPDANNQDLMKAMEGHIISTAHLMAIYEREK